MPAPKATRTPSGSAEIVAIAGAEVHLRAGVGPVRARQPVCRRTTARSASTIIVIRSANECVGSHPSVFFAFGGIPDQQVDLGRAQEPVVDHDVVLPVEAGVTERDLAELADRVRVRRSTTT